MKQNIYDDPQFFAAYRQMRESQSGLNEALEQPAFRALLPALSGTRILDLGCGFGDLCRRALAEGATSAVGVDISRRMLGVAEDQGSDPRLRFVHSALEDFEYEGPPLDLITSSLCLHYVEGYAGLVRRAVTWLRVGGRFVFSVEHPMCTALLRGWHHDPSGRRLHWPVDAYRREGRRDSYWFVDGVVKYHRTVETYINTLVDAGLRVLRLLEPEPLPSFVAQRPELEDDRRRPPFLILAAERT